MKSEESETDKRQINPDFTNQIETNSVMEYVSSITDTHRSAGPVGYKADTYLSQYDPHLKTKYNQFKVFQIFAVMRLYQDWPNVVGPLLAKQTRLLAIQPPILKVAALNSPCLQQLQMMKRQLLQKINAYYGKTLMTDIELSMYKQSYIKEEGVLAYGATQATETYERPLLDFEAISLSEAELATIEQVVTHISEPSMRETFREAQIKQYKKTKYLKAHGYHPCAHCDSLVGPTDTVCMACTLKAKEQAEYEYRQRIEAIKTLLFEQPYLVYDDVCKLIIPCAMADYQLAHRECVYFLEIELFVKHQMIIMIYICYLC